MSVSLDISDDLPRRLFGTFPRDLTSVRITIGMIEHLLQPTDQILTENVLDLFRITVDMVRGDAGFLREKQFPKSVVANDLCGTLRSRRRQGQAVGIQCAQAHRGERLRDAADIGDTFSSCFGECRKR